MTEDERLANICIKIERAKEQFSQLEVEVHSFIMTEPYKVETKRDRQTRRLVYYLASANETPARLAVITGDVLHNLRSALDHLAYQLVLVGGGTPSKQTYFPISADFEKYKAEQPIRVKGMRPDAILAIDAIKPYRGGNDTLWILHRLNNVDKHRLLITVGSAYRSFNIGPQLHRMMAQGANDAGFRNADKLPVLDLFLIPADRIFPLKAGDELFIDAPDALLNEKMQFAFDVAIGEHDIIESEPLLKFLKQMIDTVDSIGLSFRPYLA